MNTTRRIVRIALFSALTIVGAWISIPVPFTPVKFTLQTLFVVLSGLILGARDGCISQIVYAVMGLIGIPVFTQGGGFMYIFQPSFGYIIGFSIGAFIVGAVFDKVRKKSFIKIFLSCFVGMAAVYVIGITYQVTILYTYTGLALQSALATVPSILVMLVADTATLLFVAALYPRVAIIAARHSEKKNMPSLKEHNRV